MDNDNYSRLSLKIACVEIIVSKSKKNAMMCHSKLVYKSFERERNAGSGIAEKLHTGFNQYF